ncbi:MAG: dihydroorotase [Thermodesulfobacteriota bacterium]|nr:dihydroorotase [Thermodesulfobacteriota bacterium]
MSLLFRNARVIDPANEIDGRMDVLVEGDKIVEIGPAIPESRIKLSSPATDSKDSFLPGGGIIDCAGKILVPGLFDLHCHLREPGFEYKETIESGSRAGAAGGFTSLVCMANTFPVNDCRAVTEYILRQARERACTHVFPVGAVTKGLKGESLAEMAELKDAGAVAFSDDGKPVMNTSLFRRALEYARGIGMAIISHCEDLNLTGQGVMNEGFVSTTLGLRGIPNAAEEIMVLRDIALAELTGASLHVAHVSTAGSVRAVREAKRRGIKVTAETAPHYFSLTDEAVLGFDPNTKMNPPLRKAEDVLAVIEGLKDGTLDAIATDHAPQSAVEKDVEFDYAANGIIGLETALPLTLKLVHDGHLTLMEAIAKLTVHPARILGLEKGKLKVGADADITLIDLEREYTVEVGQFKSRSRNSPFQGWKLKGAAVMTVVSGKVVFRAA